MNPRGAALSTLVNGDKLPGAACQGRMEGWSETSVAVTGRTNLDAGVPPRTAGISQVWTGTD